jgi:cyclic pyranopterin phosphate synthase
MKPSCSIDALENAWRLAIDYDMSFHLDLVSYSVPFFNAGPDGTLQFKDSDTHIICCFVERLLDLHAGDPKRFPHSRQFLRSIPDWLLLKDQMRVPCDAYEGLWIGANGAVQLCDTAFPLGNINETRLRNILFSAEHHAACRNGFLLNCPNCICRLEQRITKDSASYARYS